jgi:polyhydroxyalkanoate synthesis repressor PhaR
MVTIKKYSNRRLYNTDTSSYITQEDVVILIKHGKKFKIIDAETKNDITSSILTQIILERENSGMNLIPEDFLKQIILFNENNKASEMFSFLSNVMNFADANKFFTGGFDNMMKFNPFDFQSYFANLGGSTNGSSNGAAEKDEAPPADLNERKIQELVSQVQELKSQLDNIKK